MEFSSLFANPINQGGVGHLLDFTSLNVAEKQHLSRVYTLLTANICISGLGVFFHQSIFSIPFFLSFIGAVGCLLISSPNPSGKVFTWQRVGFFSGISFFLGTLIGDFLALANMINPAIIPTAFFGSLAIFACLSIAALTAQRRSLLFLGSILGSILCYLSLMSLVNFFFQSPFVSDVSLYLGFFMYLGYVLYDTQVIIEDFKQGNQDYFAHAIRLYMDLFSLFIRLVAILMEKEKKNKRSRD